MDDLAAENRRLTDALADLERDQHNLQVRYRQVVAERDWAREQARVFRRAILRAARDEPKETP